MSSEPLYGEILEHYRACRSNPTLLSDTWAHTLRQKGYLYSIETLRGMLELGNPANTWIDDFTYLIDAALLDPADPVVRKLLEAGEPEVGRPRRDCRVGDRWYSSNYVHHVFYASKVIRAIEARGLARPRILEIGGGLGGVAATLRQYFGDRCTYFVADLPEGLVLQEWYLRSVFPEAPHSYKPDGRRTDFVDRGFNFINAYDLDSQDFPFDVAINIDSMQEMNRDAIQAYLGFIERNISGDGLFYFQNNYGQSSDPVPEPSEYPLDDRWVLAAAEPAPQHECCTGAEQARLIFHRSREPVDAAARRLALRILWNGFLTAKIVWAPDLVEELSQISQRNGGAPAADRMASALERRDVSMSPDQVRALQDQLYLPHRSFLDHLARGPGVRSTAASARRMEAVWRAQSSFLAAMASADAALLDEVSAALADAGDVSASPFYSGQLGSILGVVQRGDAAEHLFRQSVERSPNPFWTVRFATLLARFGRHDAARDLLRSLPPRKDLEFYVALKTAELLREPDLLSEFDPGEDLARKVSWAKTASRLGRRDEAFREARDIVARMPSAAPGHLLSILTADPQRRLRSRLEELLPPAPDASSEESPVLHGFLLLELQRRKEALALLEPQVQRFQDDYFRLGQIGRFFCAATLPELADRCLDRSAQLRPGAFMHFEFVGNAYLGCARFDRAALYFQRALALKPTPRHILAKASYSVLPAALRESGRFGTADDLRLVFQREQAFYHDLAPASK